MYGWPSGKCFPTLPRLATRLAPRVRFLDDHEARHSSAEAKHLECGRTVVGRVGERIARIQRSVELVQWIPQVRHGRALDDSLRGRHRSRRAAGVDDNALLTIDQSGRAALR